jgi:hypothetical protein
MKSLFQIEIPKRNSHCSQNGERLAPGMEVYSLVCEDEAEVLARRDYCPSCWPQVEIGKERKEESLNYWKSKIEKRKIINEPSRIARAMLLFRELLQSSPPQEEEIYILCIFLSHARQLALRQEFQKEGAAYQLYEVLRQEEEFITVKSFNLSHLQIEQIQKSLASKLSVK